MPQQILATALRVLVTITPELTVGLVLLLSDMQDLKLEQEVQLHPLAVTQFTHLLAAVHLQHKAHYG
jgi:hypothetical protein